MILFYFTFLLIDFGIIYYGLSYLKRGRWVNYMGFSVTNEEYNVCVTDSSCPPKSQGLPVYLPWGNHTNHFIVFCIIDFLFFFLRGRNNL